MLSTDDIINVLPHKHPYLLVDRIVEMEEGERVLGVKAVTYAESVFGGHYPGNPIFPGALIIEASSQVAGFLVGFQQNLIGYVVEIKEFKFRKQVKPGCLLKIEAVKVGGRGPFVQAAIDVTSDDESIASGNLQLFVKKQTA